MPLGNPLSMMPLKTGEPKYVSERASEDSRALFLNENEKGKPPLPLSFTKSE